MVHRSRKETKEEERFLSMQLISQEKDPAVGMQLISQEKDPAVGINGFEGTRPE